MCGHVMGRPSRRQAVPRAGDWHVVGLSFIMHSSADPPVMLFVGTELPARPLRRWHGERLAYERE